MKSKDIISRGCLVLVLALLAACSQDAVERLPLAAKQTPMTFRVAHPGETRVTDTAFEAGDSVGLFVVSDTATLEVGGNLVNNEALTLRDGSWTSARLLYWDDGTFNVYAYYPYRRVISNVDEEPFSVSSDQSVGRGAGQLGGYEASDLLYASGKGLKASGEPVLLQFRHIMSKLKIRLVKGEDFKENMPTTAQVYIHNTVADAVVDIAAGVVTRNVRAVGKTIKARQDDDYAYSAILVPQRIDGRVPLVEVVMNGVSYIFESKFVFKSGVEHRINLVISENPEQVRIDIGGEVEDWK